jgi:hypothetical protein
MWNEPSKGFEVVMNSLLLPDLRTPPLKFSFFGSKISKIEEAIKPRLQQPR